MIRLAFSAKLDHLYRLTDNTGIRQRVRLSDPNAGYFVEQNALALIVAIRALRLTRESGLLDYVRHYVGFVEQAQRPDGFFRAYMSPDGRWQGAAASEEAQGVAVWALGFAAKHSAQTEVRMRALRCLDMALPRVRRLCTTGGRDARSDNGASHEASGFRLRARAAVLLGLEHWREAEPASALDDVIDLLASNLASAYQAASADWPWFEPELAPASPRLPQALLGTSHEGLAVESLAWLCRRLERAEGFMEVSLPAEAAALVSACLAAYEVSEDRQFRRWAELGYEWFRGKNAAATSLLDPETGGCCDRLGPDGVDPDRGAEALLAWLMASLDMAEAGF